MAETLRLIRDQSRDLFGQMKPHQRMNFVVLGLMVMMPFGWLIFGRSDSGVVPLQWGAAFDSEALSQAEEALLVSGLNDFDTRGQRIYVPANEAAAYNGALLAAGITSPHSAGEIEKMLKETSPWGQDSVFREKLKVYQQKEIGKALTDIDGIHDARVFWSAPSGKDKYRSDAFTEASVMVMPTGGRELTQSLVESVRASVAGMIPNLSRDNVVIVDRSNGRSWSGSTPGDPLDNKIEEKKRGIIEYHQSRIRNELERIVPNVVVALNIEFDNVVSARERSQQIDKPTELTNIEGSKTSTSSQGSQSGVPGTQSNQPRNLSAAASQPSQTQETERSSQIYSAPSMTVTERQLVGVVPKTIRVSASIPTEHLEQLAIKDGVLRGTSEQEQAEFKKAVEQKGVLETAKVESILKTLLPATTPADAILVTTHHHSEPEIPELDVPVTMVVGDFVRQWGSTLALGIFALWTLLTLKKSMPVSTSTPSSEVLDTLAQTIRPAEPEKEEAEAGPKTNREQLQAEVEDDPAGAAAVITEWLQHV